MFLLARGTFRPPQLKPPFHEAVFVFIKNMFAHGQPTCYPYPGLPGPFGHDGSQGEGKLGAPFEQYGMALVFEEYQNVKGWLRNGRADGLREAGDDGLSPPRGDSGPGQINAIIWRILNLGAAE